MDEYKIRITDDALNDIISIRNNIIKKYHSLEDALFVEAYIYDKIQELKTFPDAHRLYKYNSKTSRQFRVITAHRKYNIYYYVKHQKKEVIIYLILHNKRDIRQVLRLH